VSTNKNTPHITGKNITKQPTTNSGVTYHNTRTIVTPNNKQGFMSHLLQAVAAIAVGASGGSGVSSSTSAAGSSMELSGKYLTSGITAKHSGGTVPGVGDMMAVLKGGETVRTEGQEADLQEELAKKDMVVPIDVCREGKTPSKNSLQPRLTKDDDKYMLAVWIDAIKRNRYGIRTLIRSC
jgi:hypothetical protein